MGVFDSGTGGLTVLKEILEADRFDNRTHLPGRDGRRDFEGEDFVYLGDQANMPYGAYPEHHNTPLLLEHILKDVQFLLGRRYYPSPEAPAFREDKQPVKAIVIACNTATAWGMRDIANLLERGRLPLKAIGVIDAGARGAVATFSKRESGSIGVQATVGTVQSDGYGRSLRGLLKEGGYTGRVSIVQQGSEGIAGAVDGAPEYINATAQAARADYTGPKPPASLIGPCGFESQGNHLLREGGRVQLNSIENHIAYDTCMLVEQVRRLPGKRPLPLKTVVLGCTHFPFYADVFRKHLRRMYNYRVHGRFPYRRYVAPEVRLIDPAVNVADELYSYLAQAGRFRESPGGGSEFYVSVPNPLNPKVETDGRGQLTTAYKYSRQAGTDEQTVHLVPFSRRSIQAGILERLREKIPSAYGEIVRFNRSSPKLREMAEADRITK